MPTQLKPKTPFDIPLSATGSWTVVICGQQIKLFLQRMRVRDADGRISNKRYITHAILNPTDSPDKWKVWSYGA